MNEPSKAFADHSKNIRSSDDDYEDEDDLVSFEFASTSINLQFSQFSKYSKAIRNKYHVSDIRNHFHQEMAQLQSKYLIDSDNIIFFFKLLHDDFNIDESFTLSYKQCLDLLQMSKYFEIKKLTLKLEKYMNSHSNIPLFIIQTIEYETKWQNPQEVNWKYELNPKMEEILSQNINEILTTDVFQKLPISIIYRILSKTEIKNIKSDLLFDFIMKSFNEFCVLLPFLDVETLSDEKLETLNEIIQQNERSQTCPDYNYFIPCNFQFIIKLKRANKKLHDLENTAKTSEEERVALKIQIGELKNQLENSVKEKCQLQQELNQLNQVKQQIEKEKNQLKERLDNITKITGKIKANIKNDAFLEAEILLHGNETVLDKTKSKYIISTDNSAMLGWSAYENGESIQSMTIQLSRMLLKPGVFYVRAFITNIIGKSIELVSNSIEKKTKSLLFEYEGKSREINLSKGKYKLEVWGAQGGDSTSRGSNSSIPRGNGGLGGYSSGILNLSKSTKIFICVGGKGCSGNQEDGSEMSGGFPDGGGTKTGHCDCTSAFIAGTGGGSTSMMISTNSLYSRVIVAGGGGGASGRCSETDHGGFGGGENGGNSQRKRLILSAGAGTQTGSTPGMGGSTAGLAGTFGHGASSKYSPKHAPGGGGGGGWYGGGSGGLGNTCFSASGGGGSGWVLTEQSLNIWKSGDPTEFQRFNLDSSFYLTDAITLPGNSLFPSPSGNNETGHPGDGYAKITPL